MCILSTTRHNGNDFTLEVTVPYVAPTMPVEMSTDLRWMCDDAVHVFGLSNALAESAARDAADMVCVRLLTTVAAIRTLALNATLCVVSVQIGTSLGRDHFAVQPVTETPMMRSTDRQS